MTFSKIIAVTGKPGLYKILSQNKGNLIVESLTDKNRFPITATHNINTLQDIAIYNYDKEIPLRQVLLNIFNKENAICPINPKDKGAVLMTYFREILPEYDEDRVYASNIKKVIMWYNLLFSSGFDFKSLEENDEDKTESQ